MHAAKLIPIYRRDPSHPQSAVCTACGVRQFALFGALDDAALDRIHQHIADIRVEPGHRIYSAQAPGQAVYTVRGGVVRLERVSEGGERRILRLAGRTDLIGLEALLGQSYAADAVACTTVEVCRIPKTLIDELSAGEPQLVMDLMKRWQRALDDAEEWLAELATGPARRRMLRLLLKLSEFADPAGLVWMPMRDEMGAMLDMTVETASRIVSALRREGVIEPVGPREARIDMPRLLAALNAQDAG
jgi:CRP/FNR family transcriptional regulator, anaerobic regulatory protein